LRAPVPGGGDVAAPSHVFVTGATGFVGTTLVRLLRQRGHPVSALARPSSDRAPLAADPPRWYEGDLGSPAELRRALTDFAGRARTAGRPAHVVHAAARISYRTRETELSRRVNVDGTRALLDACVAARVDRLCHVSSVVAVGHAPDASSRLDETAAFNGAQLGCAYVTTKREAEEAVLARTDELDVRVVNPGAIFGPAPSLPNTSRFLGRLAEGRLGPLAPPGSLSVVSVEDVARGIVLALERGRRGRRYLLTAECYTALELFRLAAEELGVPGPRGSVPSLAWGGLVRLTGLVDRLRPLSLTTPESLRLLGLHYRFDSTRAREELGWAPRPFPSVLQETIAALPGATGN